MRMASDQIANYLQVLRRKSGLSQSDLKLVLEVVSETQVSRHERSATIPGLLAALGYEVLFQRPVSEIFPGLCKTLSAGIEERLLRLEGLLNESTCKGRRAESIARKLEFMWERKNPEPPDAGTL